MIADHIVTKYNATSGKGVDVTKPIGVSYSLPLVKWRMKPELGTWILHDWNDNFSIFHNGFLMELGNFNWPDQSWTLAGYIEDNLQGQRRWPFPKKYLLQVESSVFMHGFWLTELRNCTASAWKNIQCIRKLKNLKAYCSELALCARSPLWRHWPGFHQSMIVCPNLFNRNLEVSFFSFLSQLFQSRVLRQAAACILHLVWVN